MLPSYTHRETYCLHTYGASKFASPIDETSGLPELISSHPNGLIRMIDEILDSETEPHWVTDHMIKVGYGPIPDPYLPLPNVALFKAAAFIPAREQSNRVMTETATVIDFAKASNRQTVSTASNARGAPTLGAPTLGAPTKEEANSAAIWGVTGSSIVLLSALVFPMGTPIALLAKGVGLGISGVGAGRIIKIVRGVNKAKLTSAATVAGHFLAASAGGSMFAQKVLPIAAAALVPLAA